MSRHKTCIWVVDWSHSRTCSRLSVTVVRKKPCVSKTSPAKSLLRTTRPTWQKMIRLVVRTENLTRDSVTNPCVHLMILSSNLSKRPCRLLQTFLFFLELHFLLAASSSPGKLPIWLIFLPWRHNKNCYLLKLIEHSFHFAPMLSRFFRGMETSPDAWYTSSSKWLLLTGTWIPLLSVCFAGTWSPVSDYCTT